MTYFAFIVGATLLVVLLVPSFTLAIAGYATAGIANSYLFAATLAAQNEYFHAAAAARSSSGSAR